MDNKDQMKGKIKQAVGDLTGNQELKRHGKADAHAGRAKVMIDDAKDKLEHLYDSARGKLTHHRTGSRGAT
jgi:uncharacterized protein YjbJ (UPF0337 family)